MAGTMKFMSTAFLPEYSQPRVARASDLPQAWAVDLVEWLRTMVRKHRLICVGYEKLFKMMACDLLVVKTLDAMGIAAPSWDGMPRVCISTTAREVQEAAQFWTI